MDKSIVHEGEGGIEVGIHSLNLDSEQIFTSQLIRASVNDKDEYCLTPLHIACKENRPEIVESLLNSGARVNVAAYKMSTKSAHEGYTPLHYAVEVGSLVVTKLLLRYNADVNVKAVCGTPLHLASVNRNAEIVKMLLSKGADVNAVTEDHLTPLYIAVKNKCRTIIKLLLEHGADVNIPDGHGITVLYLAVDWGSLSITNEILKFHPDPNNETNRSSLKLAVHSYEPYFNNQERILENLLEYGFCFNSEDINDSKLLHGAIRWGYLDVVEVLLRYGADVNMRSEFPEHTPLHTAVIYQQMDIIELLIKYGANMNAKDATEKSAMTHAIDKDQWKIVKLLLVDVAETDVPNLFITAVMRKSMNIVKLLLERCSDINLDSTDEFGRTALYYSVLGHTAGLNPRENITKLLLDRGSNANIRSRDGTAALHAAVAKGLSEVVQMLLEYGAEVNARGQADTTPLHMATLRGNVEIVEILIAFGADVDLFDGQGRIALHTAFQGIHGKIAEVLLQNGSDINIKSKETLVVQNLAGMRSLTQQVNMERPTYGSENAKIAIKHIAILKAKQLFIDEAYIQRIHAHSNLKCYFDSCMKEITEMKKVKIKYTCVSPYDLLTKSIGQLAICARNRNIINFFESYSFYKFPIYADVVEIRFKKGQERGSLLSKLYLQSFQSLIGFELPHHVTHKIVSYLRNVDLKRLIDACPNET